MPITAGTRELDAVRHRRAELRETLLELERALAAPTADDQWATRLRTATSRLAADFALHVDVTEGPDGLHQAILAGDLRLANQVATLTAEHAAIAAEIAAVSAAVSAACESADAEAVRERATSLLGRLIRHRQRGADLVYQAFVVDIGGGD